MFNKIILFKILLRNFFFLINIKRLQVNARLGKKIYYHTKK